ncbi:MAG: HAD hydrolase-like protein [Clostridia bacterium]|nr:HAD hydrolase-like protein [Clostridia bacterium]
MDKKYTTILFDLDGTLIDSKPGILASMRKTLNAYSIPYTEAIIDKMVGPPIRVSYKELLGITDMDLMEDMIVYYRKHYREDDWRDCKVYEGVYEMLEKLKALGYTLGVATSKPYCYTTIIMEELGLDKYFDYIGGATGDSSVEMKTDVINSVLAGLNVQDLSSVLMIGDRLYDIEGAKSSGVDSMGILWGYGGRAEHEKYGADYIMSTIDEVVEFLS